MSTQQEIHISISIVVYHTPPGELDGVLQSLLVCLRKATLAYPLRAQLSLINNGDNAVLDSHALSKLQTDFAAVSCELSVQQAPGNIGYGAGHNLAIHSSTARYHLLLNPDVKLHEDSLREGLAYLEAHAEAVLVAPFVSDGAEQKQYLCKRYPAVLDFLLRSLPRSVLPSRGSRYLAHYEMRDLPEDRASGGVPIISGCFMLCRGEPLRAAGGFDSRYFMYFEDFDLSLRLSKTGDLVYLPSMRIQHFGGHSSRKGLRHILMFLRSGIRFFNTHGWRFIQ